MEIRFQKVVEFVDATSVSKEHPAGVRYRKVDGGEAKKYHGAVRGIYESAKDTPSFGWFIPVGAKLKSDDQPKLPGMAESTEAEKPAEQGAEKEKGKK